MSGLPDERDENLAWFSQRTGDHDRGGVVAPGVDGIEIGRIAQTLEQFGARFLNRVYTQAEQTYCGDRVQRLAGRFAGKEAVSKALGTGIRSLRWRDIEILPDERGKPTVTLHGKAAARARRIGLQWMEISITHTRDLAIVMVVAG